MLKYIFESAQFDCATQRKIISRLNWKRHSPCICEHTCLLKNARFKKWKKMIALYLNDSLSLFGALLVILRQYEGRKKSANFQEGQSERGWQAEEAQISELHWAHWSIPLKWGEHLSKRGCILIEIHQLMILNYIQIMKEEEECSLVASCRIEDRGISWRKHTYLLFWALCLLYILYRGRHGGRVLVHSRSRRIVCSIIVSC